MADTISRFGHVAEGVSLYGKTTEAGDTPFNLSGASIDVNDGIAADVDAAVAAAAGLRLMGFASRESAATAAVATFRLVHGATVAGGTTLYPVELSADQSRGEWFGPDGLAVPNGISIDVIAGTVDLALFWKVVA